MVFYVCGRCLVDEDRPFNLGTTTVASVCTRCGGQAVWLIDQKINEARLAHFGISPVFSTDCSLLPWPPHIWDVNGYYRELGVPTNATRKQIRMAYLAKNGHSDDRLTYIVKQLLDPEVRQTYDSCQPGEVLFDRYLEEIALRRAKAEAARAIANGEIEDGDSIDMSDSLNNAIRVLDKDRETGKYDGPRAKGPWGYYLWSVAHPDQEKLASLRTEVAAACWRRGVTTNLGVGIVGSSCAHHPWVVKQVGEVPAVFIREDERPTPEMADAIAEHIINGA